jgi:hypothetical protein
LTPKPSFPPTSRTDNKPLISSFTRCSSSRLEHSHQQLQQSIIAHKQPCQQHSNSTSTPNPELLLQNGYCFMITTELLWKLPLHLKKRIASYPFLQHWYCFYLLAVVWLMNMLSPTQSKKADRLVGPIQASDLPRLRHCTVLHPQDG